MNTRASGGDTGGLFAGLRRAGKTPSLTTILTECVNDPFTGIG